MNRLAKNRWLLARRGTQLGILGLFMLGPWFGLWIVKGNLSFSETAGTLPLTDPFVLLQSLFAGHWPETIAITGVVIVIVFYLLLGRVYCSWVCPLNMVTDFASWLRNRLGIKTGSYVSRDMRYWLLLAVMLLPVISGVMVWELVNPVSLLHRGLIFGMSAGWLMIAMVFLIDLLVSRRAWCGHICPMGAFYSLLGKWPLLRVSAKRRTQCNDCMDCYAVCPEPQVIKPALKGAEQGHGPLILDAHCTNCARCLDVCSKDVFEFSTRFNNRADTA
ncbi:MAG TPA: quinol dehydrogenase ferredoxin subunit NapH [Gammaproteobacteria bacterium]